MEETLYPRDVFDRYFPLEDAITCVGPGWKNIIIELWTLCRDNKISIHQIKEKFGGLRFYVAPTDIKMMAIIDNAETKAARTCELCGKPGKLRNSLHWHKTLCKSHYNLSINDYETYRKLIWNVNVKGTMKTCHLFSDEAMKEIVQYQKFAGIELASIRDQLNETKNG